MQTTRHRNRLSGSQPATQYVGPDNLFIGREPKRFGFLRRKEWKSVPPN